jgi:hypothetical protein
VFAGKPDELAWRKSSACDPSECVEVASCGDHVLVRDSEAAMGPFLMFPHQEWHSFISRIAGDMVREIAYSQVGGVS